MAVAKSYEGMEQIGQPYEQNGKMYVIVRGNCPRCGGSGHYSMNAMGDTTCYRCGGSGKERIAVRWYTESQRAALDRAAEKRKAAAKQAAEERRIKFAAHNAFGFGEENHIMLFWGDNTVIKEWRDIFPEHTILWNTIFGWFAPAKSFPLLTNIPQNINNRILTWNEVRDENDSENLLMKPNEIVHQYVESITVATVDSPSEYQGEINDWLELDVMVKRTIEISTNYGSSKMYIMEDADHNVYVWTTSSKHLDENVTYHLRMKVKDHREYKGVKQTVVYYCKVK